MDDEALSDPGPASVLTPAVGVPQRSRPRWRIARAPQRVSDSTAPSQRRQPINGSPRTLANRLLVQASAGAELEAVLPHITQDISGLVLSAGRSGRKTLRDIIHCLPDRGFTAPVAFDPEGYRRHVASVEAPFYLMTDGLFGETLDDALAKQIALGVTVAQTPTGYIRVNGLDALNEAAEQANALDRDDFLFTAPLDAAILDDSALVERVVKIISSLKMPTSLVLGSQFDPFDSNAETRITAARYLVAGPANVAPFRTDFNGFDLLAHGGFAGAIGVGGSKRHAIDPEESAHSFNHDDASPSVLYPRLVSFWRGSKIAEEHGRLRAPACECAPCDQRSLARFLSSAHTNEARAHGVVIWQEWAQLMFANADQPSRAASWKRRCQAAVDDHGLLAVQLGRAKTFAARAALKAWAKLPA